MHKKVTELTQTRAKAIAAAEAATEELERTKKTLAFAEARAAAAEAAFVELSHAQRRRGCTGRRRLARRPADRAVLVAVAEYDY